MHILLTGSYNGQDSLGDKCLLRCVIGQFQKIFGKGAEFVTHVHGLSKSDQTDFPQITFSKGVSAIYWTWHNKLRHFRFPFFLHIAVTFISLPIFLISSKSARISVIKIWADIKKSSLMYFYGGTQLSQKWFWFNFIPLFITILLCRINNAPVYFGPQQYGPQTRLQRIILRFIIALFVKDIRTRNTQCLQLLGLPYCRLCHDEVFSCADIYPIIKDDNRRKDFILVNMRGIDFVTDSFYSGEYAVFLKLLIELQHRIPLPYKLFQMSGASFCDDARLFMYLRHNAPNLTQIELLQPFKDGRELINLARQAFGAISMSFHGCMLSLIGGCPAVPVSFGGYYDYKYADFDRYAGGQKAPIIRLNSLNLDMINAIDKVCLYFSAYQPLATAGAREEASNRIVSWYQGIKRQYRDSS